MKLDSITHMPSLTGWDLMTGRDGIVRNGRFQFGTVDNYVLFKYIYRNPPHKNTHPNNIISQTERRG